MLMLVLVLVVLVLVLVLLVLVLVLGRVARYDQLGCMVLHSDGARPPWYDSR